jgi:hypothetical protein
MMNEGGKKLLTARGIGRVTLNAKVSWLKVRRSAGYVNSVKVMFHESSV